MPSAKRQVRLAVLALCAALLVGGLSGCETTQEKATAKQAEAAHILKAREERRQKKHHHEKEKG